jgi:hypothetical protein
VDADALVEFRTWLRALVAGIVVEPAAVSVELIDPFSPTLIFQSPSPRQTSADCWARKTQPANWSKGWRHERSAP